jgi:hypothetical protein
VNAVILARLPAVLGLLVMVLAACAAPPAPRGDSPERPDPRIVPLTLEQHRQIAE